MDSIVPEVAKIWTWLSSFHFHFHWDFHSESLLDIDLFKIFLFVPLLIYFYLHLHLCLKSSVQFSHSVMSESWRPRGLQHTRPPYPLSTAGVYSSSCPLSLWCHLTMSSSIFPFSSCLQSFSASGSFPASGSSHQVDKILEFQLQHQSFQWISGLISFRMDWLDVLAVQGTLKSLLQHYGSKHQFFNTQLSL